MDQEHVDNIQIPALQLTYPHIHRATLINQFTTKNRTKHLICALICHNTMPTKLLWMFVNLICLKLNVMQILNASGPKPKK